ncbi:MAG: family 43 glycosylhydrolase [Acidobacteriota bacterium]|nr:family 43 glycosylhydrolase [Acidobacteriota bacterium]
MNPQIDTDRHRFNQEKEEKGIGENFSSTINPFSLKKSVFICVYLWLILFALNSFAQTYTNPVIPGDFPDPSVIRVGEDYYATATTGGWSPEFPILHSKDLVNWQIVSAVFPTKPAWAKGDFWAPEMTEDKGKFYVFYTGRRDEGKGKKGTLCVAVAVSDKPDKDYIDKGALVCQEMGSLDPFFIRDETGKPFLIWKEDGNDRQQPTWLYAQQLDESLTKLIGKPKRLFRNEGSGWENHVIEGADVVKHGEYYYLFYSGNACCGRSCNYALGVARSKTLLGNWEKNPANPILPANDVWQCPGHGTIVETPNGADFLLYHAYRKRADAFNIGREALLDKVEWTSDGWATINGGKGPSNGANLPVATSKQQKSSAFVDEFDASILSPNWQLPLSPTETIDLKAGTLAFAANDASEAVVATRTVSGNYLATTSVKTANMTADEIVGLSAYSWRGNAVGIGFGAGKVSAWRREDGKQIIAASADMKPSQNIYLRMIAKDGELYQFAYSSDGENWTNLGEPVAGSQVEGARVALTHIGKTETARFDWLKITQINRAKPPAKADKH